MKAPAQGAGRAFHEKVDMAVLSANPEFRRLCLRLHLTADGADAGAARDYLEDAVRRVRAGQGARAADLQAWREAYARLGMGDAATPPPEALLAWAALPQGLPSQGPLRDLVHGFMLRTGIPAAAYALDQTAGDLWLRPSRGNERFQGLGEARPASPAMGEIILADTLGLVLARHWQGEQGRETLVGPAADLALVHLDYLPPLEPGAFGSAASRFERLAGELLGARVEQRELSWDRPDIAWPAIDVG